MCFFGLAHVPSFHNELRDEDLAKFSAREEEVKLIQTQHKQMEMRLLSAEKTYAGLEENARYEHHNFFLSYLTRYFIILRACRRQIQILEVRLAQMRGRADGSSIEYAEKEIAAYAEERGVLAATNNKLREENLVLKDEVEELKAMVELLKAQHTGQRGLVSEPKGPILGGPL